MQFKSTPGMGVEIDQDRDLLGRGCWVDGDMGWEGGSGWQGDINREMLGVLWNVLKFGSLICAFFVNDYMYGKCLDYLDSRLWLWRKTVEN